MSKLSFVLWTPFLLRCHFKVWAFELMSPRHCSKLRPRCQPQGRLWNIPPRFYRISPFHKSPIIELSRADRTFVQGGWWYIFQSDLPLSTCTMYMGSMFYFRFWPLFIQFGGRRLPLSWYTLWMAKHPIKFVGQLLSTIWLSFRFRPNSGGMGWLR